MTVIRELVTVFGVKFDKGSASKAEAQQKSFLQTAVKAAGFIIAGKKLGEFMLGATNLASSVVENLNVMGQAFGKNEEEVHQWAETFGAAAYRNKYELEKMAAGVGAVLHPMLGGSTEEIAKMSTALTELAIDYSSFRELKDIDVMRAVQAGIVGEIEPLRRLGVVMTQDALNAFALEKGLNKTTREMNLAEKTTLRYNYLMEKSELVTGDAIKTADNYANAVKGIKAGLGELATELGLSVMPVMSRMVIWTRNIIWGFKDWVKGTEFLKASMIVLTGVLIALGVKLMAMFIGPLLVMAKFLFFFVLAILIIDDFLVFLKGGKSIIGDFIDLIWGPGSATAAAKALREAWQLLKIAWIQDILPAIKALGLAMGDHYKTMVSDFEIFIEKIVYTVGQIKQAFKDLFSYWDGKGKKSSSDLFNALNSDLEDYLQAGKDIWGDIKVGVNKVSKEVMGIDMFGVRSKDNATYYETEGYGSSQAPSVAHGYPESDKPTKEDVLRDMEATKNKPVAPNKPKPTIPATGRNGQGNITVNQNNNVNVAGNATPEAVSKVNKAQKNNTGKGVAAISALTQRAPAK